MTSSISNGLVALYGSDERIINNNNNTVVSPIHSFSMLFVDVFTIHVVVDTGFPELGWLCHVVRS